MPAPFPVADQRALADYFTNQNLTPTPLLGLHVAVSGAAPTVANGAQTTGSTVVAGSTDVAGAIQFTTTATPAAGVQATVTFSRTFTVPPAVVLCWNGATAGTVLTANATATGFTISVGTALAASTTYTVAYVVIGLGGATT